MIFMLDGFGRTIHYMRVSVTDKCNLRCRYCMPEEVDLVPMKDLLSLEEIRDVCRQASYLGIDRIRITGGEPLVRRGVVSLVSMLKALPKVKQVTMTTNGVLLSDFLPSLIEAGLDGLNISLDTVDQDLYRRITGRDHLEDVLKGIDEALASGLPVKVNAVLMKDINEEEWEGLLSLAKDRPVAVRFIELMPIGAGAAYTGLSNEDLYRQVKGRFPDMEHDPAVRGNGPAVYYKLPGYRGRIGFISPIHKKFCASCNRIRMTAMGDLKACLCYGTSINIRDVLRRQGAGAAGEVLKEIIQKKPGFHCFEDREGITEKNKMIAIGG